MIRKAIQLVGTPRTDGDPDLYALCNDGTIWGLNHGGQWVEMPAIPQDVSKDETAAMYGALIDARNRIGTAETKLANIEQVADEIPGNLSARMTEIRNKLLKILGKSK